MFSKIMVLILSLLLLAGSVFAEKKVSLGEVTVTGTGVERDKDTSPIKTLLIKKKDIEKKDAFSLYVLWKEFQM